MNIAFWGSTPGKSAVSSNMLAIAVYASIRYKIELNVMQAQYSTSRLEDSFMPISSMICMKEDFAYSRREGIDELIDSICFNSAEIFFESALISIKNTYMYYLPSTSEPTEELFERECEKNSVRLMELINRYDKPNLIDCRDGSGCLSKNMMNNCDLLVFNMEQSLHSIPKVIFENKELMEKSVFLIGRYDEASRYNIRNIRRKYHIDEERIAVIPYNIQFKDSVCEGKIVEYLSKNINCDKDSYNYYFISQLDNAVKMLFRKVGIGVK